MPDTHPKRLIRSRRTRLLAVATLLSGVLIAGCGGSAPSPSAATGRGASTSASAFAKCMRANGVPNFPDPDPESVASFAIPVGTSPAAKAAQTKCQKLLSGDGTLPGSTMHPSSQTLAKLLKIARCMRQHGVPEFPDPTTSIPSNPGGLREITDYDGAILVIPATINLEAPAYKQALAACGAPPLGLPH